MTRRGFPTRMLPGHEIQVETNKKCFEFCLKQVGFAGKIDFFRYMHVLSFEWSIMTSGCLLVDFSPCETLGLIDIPISSAGSCSKLGRQSSQDCAKATRCQYVFTNDTRTAQAISCLPERGLDASDVELPPIPPHHFFFSHWHSSPFHTHHGDSISVVLIKQNLQIRVMSLDPSS